MIFWIVLGVTAALAALWIAWPFLRSTTFELTGAEGAISIYRDQMDEVERDLKAGLISQSESDAALAEIERRALHAARSLDQGMAVSQRSGLAALALTAASALAAVGLYMALGSSGAPDQPLAARKTEILTRQADAGDVQSRIQLLIERTSENPDSFDDWWTLARAHAMIGDHTASAEAYRHAAEIAGDMPEVQSAYAEAMTLANGNKVPTAARVIFEQLVRNTDDARAHYYLALAKAQAQDFEGALAGWAALARASAPDAPWMPLVRRDIVNMARFIETDVLDYLPDATPQEIAQSGGDPGTALLPPLETAETLEQRLAEDPKDFKSWIELADLRSRAGDAEGAADALAQARQHFAGAPFVLQKIAEAERALGLDLVAAGPRGPTASDMAAASQMSEDDRADMIDGMVAGLAARLKEQPRDLDGWVMLVRSYSTLGRAEKARDAYETALLVFKDDQTALGVLRNSAGALIGN
ncbi:c-type cytochrome biogenesis protein CcmI [Seohaeicola saemankumensis]|nr:c-type cytochrome biogenesis protein CcmI [Seohaeicola saemankumensis]MCA0873782.1 c-type cytochrome biogenesis protein CcmI [Seohaeicola saemankumensis]